VNDAVFENLPCVRTSPRSKRRGDWGDDALREKYGDEVRVVVHAGCIARAVRRHARAGNAENRAVRDHPPRAPIGIRHPAASRQSPRARRSRCWPGRAEEAASCASSSSGSARRPPETKRSTCRSSLERGGGRRIMSSSGASATWTSTCCSRSRPDQAGTGACRGRARPAEDGRVHLVATSTDRCEGRIDAVEVIKAAAAEWVARGRAADDGARSAAIPRSSTTRWRRRRRRCAGASVEDRGLGYGSARTGVAVFRPTGTIARPLGVASSRSETGSRGWPSSSGRKGAERIVRPASDASRRGGARRRRRRPSSSTARCGEFPVAS